MTELKTILSDLQSEILSNIKGYGNYRTKVYEAKIGVWVWEELHNKPSITITVAPPDEHIQNMGNTGYEVFPIDIRGFIKSDDVDDIYDLRRDIKYFLLNDWSYRSHADITEGEVYGPRKNDKALEVRIRIEVICDWVASTM